MFVAVTVAVPAAVAGGVDVAVPPPPEALAEEPLVVPLELVVVAGGGVVVAGVEVVDVVGSVLVPVDAGEVEAPEPDELLLEVPQALSAKPVEKITKCRAALSACDLNAIVTCFLCVEL